MPFTFVPQKVTLNLALKALHARGSRQQVLAGAHAGLHFVFGAEWVIPASD